MPSQVSHLLIIVAVLGGSVGSTSLQAQQARPDGAGTAADALAAQERLLRSRLEATDDPYLRHMLARVLYQRGNVLEARQLWDEAAAADENLPNADVALALELLQGGRIDAARVALETALKANEKDPHAYLALADLTFRLKGLDAAREPLAKAQEYGPRLPSVHIWFGRYHLRRGDLDTAETFLTKATRLAPQRPEAWNELARLRFDQNRMKECWDAVQKAQQADFSEQPAEARMARLHLSVSDLIGGRIWLQKAIDQSPHDPELRLQLARVCGRLELNEEARNELQAALEIRESVAGLFMLATLANEEQDYEQAADLYRRAIALDPANIAARNNLAMNCLCLGGRTDEALELAEAVLESRPDEPAVLATYGCALLDAGQEDQAAPILAKAVRQLPGDAWTRYSYGKLLLSKGRHEEAREHLAGCLILDSRFPRKAEVESLLSASVAADR